MVGDNGGVKVARRRVPVPVVLFVSVLVFAAGCFHPFDFDGTDQAGVVWYDERGIWFQDAYPTPIVLATHTSVADTVATPVAGDYDGDSRWEGAVVHRSTVTRQWLPSWETTGPAGTIIFASPALPVGYETTPYYNIIPVPGMYDGGHTTIPAWYRDFDGMWFIQGRAPVQFGSGPTTPSPVSLPPPADPNDRQDQDVPVPADYDGDNTTDLAVYNPVTGVWRIQSSRDGTVSTRTLGGPNDIPAPADYDKVHRAQPAVFDFGGLDFGTWRVEDQAPALVVINVTDVLPTPADYDGDGKAEKSYLENAYGPNARWRISSMESVVISGAYNRNFPAEMPAWLIVNLARLTLVGRNACNPPSPAPPAC